MTNTGTNESADMAKIAPQFAWEHVVELPGVDKPKAPAPEKKKDAEKKGG